MAERVDNIPSATYGLAAKYPWHEWFDGSAWELIKGKDFESSTSAMRNLIIRTADRKHITAKVVVRRDRVYIQALPGGQDGGQR